LAQNFGLLAIRPLNTEPHRLGYEAARTGDDDNVFELWNGPSAASRILGLQKDGQFRAADGSDALPTYSFESDDDTGVYLAAVADLRAAIAGVDVLQIVAAAVRPLQPVELVDGDAATPALGFTDDPDTGLFSEGADSLGIAAGGTQVAQAGPGSIRFQTQVLADRVDNGTSADVDFEDGNAVRIELDGNKTITLANAVAGGQYVLELEQDGTGSRTVTWPGNVKGDAGGAPPQPDATAGRTTLVVLYFNGVSFSSADAGAYDL
jgi:hypothetical protein